MLPPSVYDYVIWYAKDIDRVKSHTPLIPRSIESEAKSYTWLEDFRWSGAESIIEQ